MNQNLAVLPMEIVVRPLTKQDWTSVSKIYADGIATGIATFETEVPDFDTWNKKYVESCRIVATLYNEVVGFGVLSLVSKRHVYRGVAEVTLYVDKDYQGNGIGKILLEELIKQSEVAGFWTLQASIFSENVVSINLHKKCGFRVVGVKERIGQINNKWYDNHFLERRSKIVN
ncbi:GNAT family N-acetyltransferase [Yeosuana sp. MJ-SS3]|uniref:GNAT family N-acetyltransferase n=1 Tax=Gilvirhabdus luticola TaxID=3079858 RepID=A0ABU3U8M0_9FLAO|nr:N-acetyltransferase family protein [Yeosuana sp. MJ-SS3]MDU8886762.1 GNAT family N-acetyltransferase [Yeosuana sp. MJ-SS3]